MHDDRVENYDDVPSVNVECAKYGQTEWIVRQLKNKAFVLIVENDKD